MISNHQHPHRWVTIGFLLGGAVNVLGTLLVSAGFTNRTLTSLDPVVFSNFGLVAIMLWGLAYVAVSRTYHLVPFLVLVFALEKLVYTILWIRWISRFGDQLQGIATQAPMTAMFFRGYGLVDFAFGVFFACVAIATLRQRMSLESEV
jgi:hypothetical protein